MQIFIPQNIIPWLLGSVILLFIGFRSWIHLSKVNSPTTRYFVVTGMLGGLGLACYSIPATISNNPDIIKVGFLIGIPLIYSMFVYQTYFTWFAILKKKISYVWLLVPVASIGFITVIIEIRDSLNSTFIISNGELIFNFFAISRFLQSVLLVFPFINGLWFLKEAFTIKDLSTKLRFAAIGIIFIIVSAGTIADNLLFNGENQSNLIVYAYIVSIIAFFITLILIIHKNAKK